MTVVDVLDKRLTFLSSSVLTSMLSLEDFLFVLSIPQTCLPTLLSTDRDVFCFVSLFSWMESVLRFMRSRSAEECPFNLVRSDLGCVCHICVSSSSDEYNAFWRVVLLLYSCTV